MLVGFDKSCLIPGNSVHCAVTHCGISVSGTRVLLNSYTCTKIYSVQVYTVSRTCPGFFIGGERPTGQKSRPNFWRPRAGQGYWGRDIKLPPHQLGSQGERCSSPSVMRGVASKGFPSFSALGMAPPDTIILSCERPCVFLSLEDHLSMLCGLPCSSSFRLLNCPSLEDVPPVCLAQIVCNCLPAYLRDPTLSLRSFRRYLKTYYFARF